jgi:hypothetical protein
VFLICANIKEIRHEGKKVPKNRVKGLYVTGLHRTGRKDATDMRQDSIHTKQCHKTARKKTCQIKMIIYFLQFLAKI